MVDYLTRSRPTSRPARQWRRPIPEEKIRCYPWYLASVIAAGVACGIGCIVVFLALLGAWLFAAHGAESTEQVVRVSGDAWLATQLVPITIGDFPLGLLPTGFLVVPVWCLWRATQWALKSSQPATGKDFWRVCLAITGAYSMICILISLVSHSDQVSTSATAAGVHGAALALVVTMVCILTYAPSPTLLLDRLPSDVVRGMRIGACAAVAIYTISALMLTALLVYNWSELTSVTQVMTKGGIDSLYLTCLMIGYLPTAAMWVASFIVGPGVWLGGQGVVSIFSSQPGALPAFPLLSILPTSTYSWTPALLAIPCAVGVGMFYALPRKHWQPMGPRFVDYLRGLVRLEELRACVSAVATFGLIIWVLSNASSGSLGRQLLRSVGPHALENALWSMTLCGLAIVILLVLPRLLMCAVFAFRAHRTSKQHAE